MDTNTMEHGHKHYGARRRSLCPYTTSRPSPSPGLPCSRSDEDNENDDEDDGRSRAIGVGSDGNTHSLHCLMANGGGFDGLRFTISKAVVRSKITIGSKDEERAPALSSSGLMNLSPITWFFKGCGGARPTMEEMTRRLEKSRRRKRDSSNRATSRW